MSQHNPKPEHDDYVSRSQKRREMDSRTDLANRLSALSSGALARLGLPDEVKEAALSAGRTKAHVAHRREVLHLARLILSHGLDYRSLIHQLDEGARPAKEEAAALRALERLRDHLIESETEGVKEFQHQFPGADLQHLHQLVRAAKKERDSTGPAGAARALYRHLRDLRDASRRLPPAVSEEQEQ